MSGARFTVRPARDANGKQRWAVFDDQGRRVSTFSTHDLAAQTAEHRNGQATRRLRRCLTCGDEFMSEGAHNRICAPCKSAGGACSLGEPYRLAVRT